MSSIDKYMTVLNHNLSIDVIYIYIYIEPTATFGFFFAALPDEFCLA